MQSWSSPSVPTLPTTGRLPRLRDTITGDLTQPVTGPQARIYVCGITPYDSTHLGHAATYIAFDTLVRTWRDAGMEVTYVQNVTDVDDPLLERAAATGVDWADLARDQVDLYASDMAALRVLAPDHFIGVAETTDLVAEAVDRMLTAGAAYQIRPEDPGARGLDTYADIAIDPDAGSVGRLDEATMDTYFAERGGDPQTPGKKHPRDPLLWRSARPGEPAFDGGALGPGRPGWHIECAVIAQRYLGVPFHVQGGGTDLIYPHHEMSTSHLRMLTGLDEPATSFVHTGLVAYEGSKMSKSLGNLVFVSELIARGVPAAAVRLAVLGQHYSRNWEYTEGLLEEAQARLGRWRAAVARAQAGAETRDGGAHDGGAHDGGARDGGAHDGGSGAGEQVLEQIRLALGADLDTPAAVAAVDAWASRPDTAAGAAGVADAVDALLGVDLRAVTSRD